LRVEPNAIGHPTLLPQSNRYLGRVRTWGCVDSGRAATLVRFDQDGTDTFSHERKVTRTSAPRGNYSSRPPSRPAIRRSSSWLRLCWYRRGSNTVSTCRGTGRRRDAVSGPNLNRSAPGFGRVARADRVPAVLPNILWCLAQQLALPGALRLRSSDISCNVTGHADTRTILAFGPPPRFLAKIARDKTWRMAGKILRVPATYDRGSTKHGCLAPAPARWAVGVLNSASEL
jgi:hypothetical protein